MGFIKNPVRAGTVRHNQGFAAARGCTLHLGRPGRSMHGLVRAGPPLCGIPVLPQLLKPADSRVTSLPRCAQISTVNMGLAVGWSCVVLSFGRKGWRKSLPHSLGEALG